MIFNSRYDTYSYMHAMHASSEFGGGWVLGTWSEFLHVGELSVCLPHSHLFILSLFIYL